jgi:hypothetical protein
MSEAGVGRIQLAIEIESLDLLPATGSSSCKRILFALKTSNDSRGEALG